MEEIQNNQEGEGSSTIWTIVKILFAVFIVYFGIMYFSKKRESKEDKFIEKKVKKPKVKSKTKK
jgi:predicted membrane protein